MATAQISEQSSSENKSDWQDGQSGLSRFIVKRDGGVYVNLSRLESPADFCGFAVRVFSASAFFRSLDYPTFLSLLYGEGNHGNAQEVRFAADIVSFPLERQALYKTLKIEGDEAVYMFEPVFLESTVDEPLMGELADGGIGVIGSVAKAVSTPTKLDIDEFIAAAWAQGVRFGIDFGAVYDAIRSQKTVRIVVARPRPFTLGQDAEIKEQTKDLQRDNAPRKLFGGKVDLCQFENRYPQVLADIRLLRKIPRVLGVNGRDIAGDLLLAPVPEDFDLGSLCSAGTRVEFQKDGEFLLSAVGGFLNVDKASGQLSITDKIINREGVSARTTGDLSLSGDDYEVHGEIQEKRLVECRSVTAYADVFGSILSRGGKVHMKKNLVGGSATNESGDIVVDGLASAAVLIALNGSVTVARADSCLIVAREIFLGQGTRCDLLAESIVVDKADGCALAGKNLRVVASGSRGQNDCVVSVLIPDLSAYRARIGALAVKRDALLQEVDALRAKSAALRAQPEVVRYVGIAGKLQRKELNLSAEQQAAWQKMVAQVTPALRTLKQMGESIKALEEDSAELVSQAETLQQAEGTACNDIACVIDQINGDTRVRTLAVPLDAPALASLPPKEIRLRLRATDAATASLFSGSSGAFDWRYTPPSP
ncbi:MAG: flagellar assembly protein A [Rhodocyclaceae bacterium]